jgi:hypothetical protein
MILLKVTTAIHTYVHAVVVLHVREPGVDVVSMDCDLSFERAHRAGADVLEI